jgi:hypothetical protein
MLTMKSIMCVTCIYYLLCMVYTVYSQENLIWFRIPEYFVDSYVTNFLNNHQINNCYYKYENSDTLLLKCMRNNNLVDISINIKNTYKQKRFYKSVSI